jgi:hypothetical protein
MHLKAGLCSIFMAIGGLVTLPALADHLSSSQVGVNYSQLENLLSSQNWEAASTETSHLVRQVSQRNQHRSIGEDWLTQGGVEQFPCRDMATIDRLWHQASNGRYGIGVQLHLWDGSLDNQVMQKDPDRWKRFRQHLGWQPRPENDFKADIEGRFPQPMKATPDFGGDAMWEEVNTFYGAAWLRRAEQCHIPKARVTAQAANWQKQVAVQTTAAIEP